MRSRSIMKTISRWSHGFVPPLLLLLTISALAQAQFTFITNNGSITIAGYCGSNGVAIIPSYTNGYPVTGIAGSAFSGCNSLTNVTIPYGVQSIGNYAFGGCASLTHVQIPDSVTSIDSGAFESCASLTNVTIPYGVSSIGEAAFAATGLTGVTIPGSVTNIGDFAFGDCGSLTNIWFAGNAPAVAASAFGFAEDLAVYYLPGTTGWSDFFASTGLSGVLWLPQVNTGDGSFGLQNNQFGFSFNWASGMVVEVEACTNLSNPQWQPVQTNALTGDPAYFTEPPGANYPGRFYRLCSP